MVTGIVYCGVILALQEVYEARRAREWTAALTRWCDGQPDLVAFTGRCLVHRAEILQLEGAWPDALEEARKARQRFIEADERRPASASRSTARRSSSGSSASSTAAEEAYREASRYGWDPQPGLAQLRLAQGRVDAALSTIRRVLGEATDPLKRAGLLACRTSRSCWPSVTSRRRASHVASSRRSPRATRARCSARSSRYARGAVHLAEGDAARGARSRYGRPRARGRSSKRRTRSRARACSSGSRAATLGDEETASARAGSGACSVRASSGRRPSSRASTRSRAAPGPTTRTGLTRARARGAPARRRRKEQPRDRCQLVISEHTVARHVQNIFAKLDVSSRAAAGAFAFEHDLV